MKVLLDNFTPGLNLMEVLVQDFAPKVETQKMLEGFLFNVFILKMKSLIINSF